MKKLLFILPIFILPLYLTAQAPVTEVRAVWLTTNWRLDWPGNKQSVEDQKAELKQILTELKNLNFNVVLFQARAKGRVFYRSSIEPPSPYFNHADNFDPLAFAVEECHKRGLECHAWIVTYPGETVSANKTKPSYYKKIDGVWHLDPGRPESRKYILSIVNEIVSNYDVDGIHFDYIRYPRNTRKFPDEDSYQKYGKGMSLFDWRRNNINQLVTEAYDLIKSKKKWVQVSSSPLGRYQTLNHVNGNDGWTARETVFQDAGYWLEKGKHDLLFPMMYYRDDNFYPFLDDWMKNTHHRIVIPGLGVYQMASDEKDWDLGDIVRQMDYTRQKSIGGQAYFRTGNVLNNLKGIKNYIDKFYPHPAKLPPLSWLDTIPPDPPVNLRVYKNAKNMLCIEWDVPPGKESLTYNVYISTTDEINTSDPRDIITTGIHTRQCIFPAIEGDFGLYYSVTASDRYHNESRPCVSAFFSHAKNQQ